MCGQHYTFHACRKNVSKYVKQYINLYFAQNTFLGCSRSIIMLGFIFFQCVILIDLLCHISFQLGYNEWVCVPNAVHECFCIITIPWSCSSRRRPANDQSLEELALPLKHYILSLCTNACLVAQCGHMKRACLDCWGNKSYSLPMTLHVYWHRVCWMLLKGVPTKQWQLHWMGLTHKKHNL